MVEADEEAGAVVGVLEGVEAAEAELWGKVKAEDEEDAEAEEEALLGDVGGEEGGEMSLARDAERLAASVFAC